MTANKFTSAADQEANVCEFVHPNTSVYTKNGPKLIKDLKLSDTLSSGAELADIMELLFDGSLLNINGNLVGPDHKLSVLQGSQKSIKHGVVAPKWLPASAIALGDYLEFSTVFATETVPLSSEECWLLGIITGQGQTAGTQIQLPYSAETDRLIKYFENAAVSYVSTKSGAALFDCPVNTSLIFKSDGSKSLAPEILHMSAQQSKSFLSGLEGSQSTSDKIQLDTASLAVQVQFIYLQTGVMTNVDSKGQLKKIGQDTEDYFIYGNSLFQKVIQKEQFEYSGPVYDLQIAGGLGEEPDTQPSYMTSGGLHHNGGGKRNGSIAVYLEPWHADVLEFVALKRNHGDEALRCRDLFLALWINDLFMKRVEANGMWSLMCPNTSPGLSDVFDKDEDHMDFTNLYERYEAEGKFVKQIKAQELWDAIIVSQIETGVPYMLYKDSVNRKSNQSNLGTIKSSNLCCEVTQYSSSEETSVCNLASVALKAFVKCFEDKPAEYDFEELHKIIKVMTRNLNNVIDINYYPVETARNSNMKHRPIGLGVQGLADTFMLMRYPFESPKAQALNKDIFETIYHAALEASCEMAAERETEILEYKQLAAIDDKPKELKRQLTQILKKTKFTQEELSRERCCGSYDSYLWNGGCPLSKGIFQFDMWNVKPSDRWNWTTLSEQIEMHGVRNSLLVAPMPTASTSQILGNFECLTGDTLVTLANGTSRRIDSMKGSELVLSWDGSGIQPSCAAALLHQGFKNTLCITLQDGRTITSTPDHLFLLENGEWKPAEKLEPTDRMVVGLMGAEDSPSEDEHEFRLCTGDMTFNMATAAEREKALAFARVLGFTMADGTLPVGKSAGSALLGSVSDLDAFAHDVKLLQGIEPTIEDLGNVFKVKYRKNLADAIRELPGIVIGRRIDQPTSIPCFIMDKSCPRAIIREFLAGHFGGDGHAPGLKRESPTHVNLSGVKLGHHAKPEHKAKMEAFMLNIAQLCEKVGVPGCRLDPERNVRNTESSYGGENTTNFDVRLSVPMTTSFEEKIGFRYCCQKQLRLSAASAYWRYASTAAQQRSEVNRIATDILTSQKCNKSTALTAAQQVFLATSVPICDYALSSYDSFRRPSKNINHSGCLPVKPFLESLGVLHWFDSGYIMPRLVKTMPSMAMSPLAVKPHGIQEVFDISVDNTHSFLAGGVMVHNCFEAPTSNIFTRRTLAGEFIVANKYLLRDLIDKGLWTESIRARVIAAGGSIQDIEEIPDDIKALYKTMWEVKMRSVIDMARDRGAFVDQSQSMNLYIANPNMRNMSSMHFYAWRANLKTGVYYCRTRAKARPQQFTVDPLLIAKKDKIEGILPTKEEVLACSLENKEACQMCSG